MKHLTFFSFCLAAVTMGALCSCSSDSNDPIPVVAPVPVENITLNKEFILLETSETKALTASLTPDEATATGAVVAWSSDKPSIATVSSDGKVTGVAEGEAVVTATSRGKTATCKVSVRSQIFTVSNQEELAAYFTDNASTNEFKPSTVLLSEGFNCQIRDVAGKHEYVELYGGGNKLTNQDYLFYGSNLSLKLNDIILESYGAYNIRMEGKQSKLTFGKDVRSTGTVLMYNSYGFMMEEGSSVDCVQLHTQSDYNTNKAERGPFLQYSGGSLSKIIYNYVWSSASMDGKVPSQIILSTKIPESWQLEMSITYPSATTIPDYIILMQGDGSYNVSQEDYEKLKGDVLGKIGSMIYGISMFELTVEDLKYDEESHVVKLDLKRFKPQE